MRHKFSVFRNAVKRYDRKRMAFVTVAIGAVAMGLLLVINEIYTLGEVTMHTEVVEECAGTSQQGDVRLLVKNDNVVRKTTEKWIVYNMQQEEGKVDFPIEISYGKDHFAFLLSNSGNQDETTRTESTLPTNSELAGDTLLGVASVTENASKEESLFSSDYLLTSPSSAVEKQQIVEEFSFMNTMEEQNADALQIQEQQLEDEADEGNEEVISLSKQDRSVLLRIVEAEATGEDVKGKMLVANVVLNRVNCAVEFPDNVTDVVFDRVGGVYQFSPVEDGRYWSVEISDETKEAEHRVLCGEDESQGALYFMARKYADADNVVWFDNSLSYLFTYGVHEFFR